MVILDRIEQTIKANGWSKSEFTRRMGLAQATFGDWRAGRSKSYEKHLSRIAEVLDTTEAYLRGETDDPGPEDAAEIDRKLIFELKRLGVIRPDGTTDYGMLEAFNLMVEAHKHILIEGAREDK